MFNWADNSTAKRFNSRTRDARLEELIRIHSFGPTKKLSGSSQVRFVGPGYTYAEHWFKFKTKAGKVSPMRKLCIGYDHNTGTFDKQPCPYCEMLGETGKIAVLQNAIIRSAQRMRPAKLPPRTAAEKKATKASWAPKYKGEFYFRAMNNESWSPVSVIKLPAGAAKDIAVLASGNKIKMQDGTRKPVGPDHPKHGFDILIRYDPNEAPAKMYASQHEGKTALTENELKYTMWKLDAEPVESLKEAQKNAERFAKTLVREDKDKKGKFEDRDSSSTDDDESAIDEAPTKKKVLKKGDKSSGKSSGKTVKSGKSSSGKKIVKKKKRSTSDMDD